MDTVEPILFVIKILTAAFAVALSWVALKAVRRDGDRSMALLAAGLAAIAIGATAVVLGGLAIGLDGWLWTIESTALLIGVACLLIGLYIQ